MSSFTPTPFDTVYKCFLSKVTDDMYLEGTMTQADTEKILKELLLNAIPHFEFPRVNLFDYSESVEEFNIELSQEEINILATYMVCEWLTQQLATVDLTRQIYTDSNFKATSQANHMQRLTKLKESFTHEGFHLQRLYKRRSSINGKVKSTFGSIMDPVEEGAEYDS